MPPGACNSLARRTEGTVSGIDTATFEKTATEAKENCPVSKALKAVEITLTARLV
jgi:osmotically inducible protein OsmC